MPSDSQVFVSEWKGKSLDGGYCFSACLTCSNSMIAIVEQVRDGTTVRVRLLMPDGDHQMVNIALAGVRSARVSSKPGEVSEPWGEEVGLLDTSPIVTLIDEINFAQAKFFTESRLLQRHVRVQILSLPSSTATPFQTGANAAAPPPASIFIGNGMLGRFVLQVE